MTIIEEMPKIRKFAYRQEKGDPEYGSCLWATFLLDTETYTLYIESDCGNHTYGWTPTPNAESFIHLMARVGEDYLLRKIAEETEFCYETSKNTTIDNIKDYFYDEEDIVEKIIEEIDYKECLGEIQYEPHEFHNALEEILDQYNTIDSHELIEVAMDFTAGAKRIVKIFKEVLQPILKEECKEDG